MTVLRVALRILALAQLPIVAFVALVGSFADGGQWWERLILVALQLAAAVFLVVLVMSRKQSKKLIKATTALLALNVAADIALSVAIGTDLWKGDWFLPLIFSVIPLIALFYCVSLLRRL